LSLSLLIGICACSCSEKLPEKVRIDQYRPRDFPVFPEDLHSSSILVLHSYHPQYEWVASINKGIRAVLEPLHAEVNYIYMDTKRHTDEAWKRRVGRETLEYIAQHSPDLVIAVDDNAQEYVARHLVNSDRPVVFCGVNSDPDKYGYPAENVTGILERPLWRESLGLLQQVYPVKRIAVLSSDDPTSEGALHYMQQLFVDEVISDWLLVSGFDEWKAAVTQLNEKVDAVGIYMFHTIKTNEASQSLPPGQVMQWTRRHAEIPIIGFFDFTVYEGALLGVVEDGEEIGKQAAMYAVDILRGTPFSSLPVIKTERGIGLINRSAARRLDIDIEHINLADIVICEGK
jgi:ABC-type uncharacterized transport system substrate-binding protein